MSELTLALAFLLSLLVSGNNLSACVGGAVGARVISYRYSLLLYILGYVCGLLIEGNKMEILWTNTEPALVASVIVFIIGETTRIPTSLTGSLYMAIEGSRWAHGESIGLDLAVAYWLISPILIMIPSFLAYRAMEGVVGLRGLSVIRVLTVITVPLLSYSFGANNLGLIWAATDSAVVGLLVVIAGSILGTLLIGWRTLYRLTNSSFTMSPLTGFIVQILAFTSLEVGTQLSIPMPITVAVAFGLLGIGAAHGFRIMNPKYPRDVVLGFLASIILGLALGYILTYAFYV